MSWLDPIAHLWSATRFRATELSDYAEKLMLDETRKGVVTMGLVFLALMLGSALMFQQLGMARGYVYTALALAALSAHVAFSARAIRELRALYLLGMALLVVSGAAFVLLAHQTGTLGVTLFTSVALLFMILPLVPWGLREATMLTLLIFTVFASSTWPVADRFDAQTLLGLQAFLFAAGLVSVTLVGRGASVRKGDIESRFALERARSEMEALSFRDPLTRAGNRRFLEAEFDGFVESVRKAGDVAHFAVLDIDRFKQLNDGFGHAHGDHVLRAIGRAFSVHLSGAGHLIRTGGDEFVLLLCDAEPEALIEDALFSVRAQLGSDTPGPASEISLSVGLVEIPHAGEVALDDAYLVADGALYRAKRARRDGAGTLQLVRTPLRPGARVRNSE